jgi:hypothetical protein
MSNRKTLARRVLLSGFGAVAAGAAFLNEVVGDKGNPATQVVDRSSSIRITGKKSYWVGRLRCEDRNESWCHRLGRD